MNPIDRLIDAVEFEPIPGAGAPDGTSYATHKGLLEIGEIELTVFQLDDGRRVIEAESMGRLFGMSAAEFAAEIHTLTDQHDGEIGSAAQPGNSASSA